MAETFDAVLVPRAVLLKAAGPGAGHRQLMAVARLRYGPLVGWDQATRPYFHAKEIYVSRVQDGRLLYASDNPEGRASDGSEVTYLFPAGHPLQKQDRYTWTPLADGAHAGRLKADPYAADLADRIAAAGLPEPEPIQENDVESDQESVPSPHPPTPNPDRPGL